MKILVCEFEININTSIFSPLHQEIDSKFFSRMNEFHKDFLLHPQGRRYSVLFFKISSFCFTYHLSSISAPPIKIVTHLNTFQIICKHTSDLCKVAFWEKKLWRFRRSFFYRLLIPEHSEENWKVKSEP